MIRIASLFIVLLLTACQTEEVKKTTDTSMHQTPFQKEALLLSDFFLPDNSTATFRGEGNEYASYTLRTIHPYDNYVITYEDNGGTIVQRIYRLTKENIGLLAENGEAYTEEIPTLESLEAMNILDLYMATPIELGTEFNEWKIVSVDETVETRLQHYEGVIVIERTEAPGNITRKYFAIGIGEIKREFIMPAEDEDITVTSVIDQIK